VKPNKNQQPNQQTMTSLSDEDALHCQYILENAYIDPEKELTYPPSAISMGKIEFRNNTYEIPICTFGNFVFIQAAPKSKKTFFVSMLISAYLSGGNKYTGEMKGHFAGQLLHIDTEQGEFHAGKTFERPFKMSTINKKDYMTLALRPYSYKQRVMFIDWYLENHDVKFLVIDGIADLVSDVNNLEESNLVAQKLMEWSHKHQLAIVTVIHTNFGSEKATGHLGSAITKKCEAQIDLTPSDTGVVSVKCKRSRNFSFKEFDFEVNENGIPYIIDHPI